MGPTIIDQMVADQIEEGDFIRVHGDEVNVTFVDNGMDIVIVMGDSYSTGDPVEYELEPYEYVDVLGA